MKKNKKLIIYTYEFDLNSGGVIVLHQLCHLLNKIGFQAYLWPAHRKYYPLNKFFSRIFHGLEYYFQQRKNPFKTNECFYTPIASHRDLEGAIVLYPEVVNGNPLKARHIVRWLLHKPGFHTGEVEFCDDELIFGYGKECSGSGYQIDEENTLIIRYIMLDIYMQTNFGERSGACHMVRKGDGKSIVHDANSVQVDGLSHEEICKVFNDSKIFITYDPYTYYSTYASICGCDSVVIPDEGVKKEAWRGREKERYGISYGLKDIEYGRKTKKMMFEYIDSQERGNEESVMHFITRCLAHFD